MVFPVCVGGLKLQKDIQACHDECSSTTLRKEKAEKELEQLHLAEDEEHLDMKEINAKCDQCKEEQLRMEEKLRDDRVSRHTWTSRGRGHRILVNEVFHPFTWQSDVKPVGPNR